MNRKVLALSIVFALSALGAAWTLEVGATLQSGNLGFSTERASSDTTFAGEDLLWGGSLYVVHGFADNLSLEGGFYRDLILRNVMYSLFTYRMDFASLGVGPFFGTFNDLSTPLKSGITTSVRLQLPGVVFVELRADNSLSGRLVQTGDYIQERNDISFGFYVHNAICTLGLSSRKFTQKKELMEVVDGLTDYFFSTDIFQKNLPFRMVFTFAYQNLTKTFYDNLTDPIHTLNSIVLGTELDLDIGSYLELITSLDSSIYTFGQDELLGISNPGPGGYLFRASVGFRLDLGKLQERRLGE